MGLPALVTWRRTGLALGYAALACLTGLLAALVLGAERDGPWLLLGAGVLLFGLLGLGFLQRTWQDPEVRDDAAVVRLRRLSSAATASYGVALIPNVVHAMGDGSGRWDWLAVVSAVLGAVAVALFAAVLLLATRWDPSRR